MIEDGPGEYVDDVSTGGEAADGGFDACQRSGVDALQKRDGIGEHERRTDRCFGPGKISGRGHVGAGESAVSVVAAGGGGAGHLEIAGEAAAVGCDADQMLGLELVGDPEGDFPGGVVAEDEEVTVS